jgi:glycosyltransferase involved in cell wall biosynthesis
MASATLENSAAPARILRSLYVCYLTLEDPLVHTQVVAYLAGLVQRGHEIHLLTFETGRLTRHRRRELRSRLAGEGIAWHGLRYHKRPTLPATIADVLLGALYAAALIRRHRLDAFHARGHMPAAMALIARRLARFRLIFDVRGLMAEEYEDAGRWARGSAPFRLTKSVEARALGRADAVIFLTERVREYLFGSPPPAHVFVIPCCADVESIEAARGQREAVRRELGLDGRTVLVYVGKFGGWYMEREMVEFFALAREQRPDLHFLILTQSDPAPIERELAGRGADRATWTITRATPAAVGGYLAAADAAIAFVRPTFSKISSSPTKIGEYLAAGLPVITIAGVGDVDGLLAGYGVGVVLDAYDRPSLERGARRLLELAQDAGGAERSRTAARERLSLAELGIPAYHAVYRHVAGLV